MVILILSTAMGLNSTSWLTLWVAMEINTMAMVWVMCKDNKKSNHPHNTPFSYYIMQVLASASFLTATTWGVGSTASTWVCVVSMLTKVGMWPFHMWYMKVIQSLSMKTLSFKILLTWQKILPLMSLCMVSKSTMTMNWMWVMLTMSVISAVSKISPKMSTKSIIGVSSLNNNGWMLLCIMVSPPLFAFFLASYTATLMTVIPTLKSTENKSNSSPLNSWEVCLTMCTLSGIPPLVMFWPKIKILTYYMSMAKSSEMCIFLVTTTTMMMYHYLWAIISPTLNKPSNQWYSEKKNNKFMMAITATSVVMGLICLTLGATKSTYFDSMSKQPPKMSKSVKAP